LACIEPGVKGHGIIRCAADTAMHVNVTAHFLVLRLIDTRWPGVPVAAVEQDLRINAGGHVISV